MEDPNFFSLLFEAHHKEKRQDQPCGKCTPSTLRIQEKNRHICIKYPNKIGRVREFTLETTYDSVQLTINNTPVHKFYAGFFLSDEEDMYVADLDRSWRKR